MILRATSPAGAPRAAPGAPHRVNREVADRLDEVARLLTEQGANPFRARAYHHAADVVRALERPVSDLLHDHGLAGLEALPGIGDSLARSIRDLVTLGRLPMLERLRGGSDPEHLFTSVPGIGRRLAERLHRELELETLEELETAAHDGRLAGLPGLAGKRLQGIRDSLEHRLVRVRAPGAAAREDVPGVGELLDVDREYRSQAAAGRLQRIAPRRFNPEKRAWLPVLHTTRGERHYTALFSNTPRAHELGRTGDWVVIYWDGPEHERQCTVVTAERGPLAGRRVVRGREAECEEHYRTGPGVGRVPRSAENSPFRR